LAELTGRSGRTAAETTDSILQSVRAHAAEHPQSDDIAVLVLNGKQ
jgi:serine phosphatase RsbU (regulator of sigma subunit)